MRSATWLRFDERKQFGEEQVARTVKDSSQISPVVGRYEDPEAACPDRGVIEQRWSSAPFSTARLTRRVVKLRTIIVRGRERRSELVRSCVHAAIKLYNRGLWCLPLS